MTLYLLLLRLHEFKDGDYIYTQVESSGRGVRTSKIRVTGTPEWIAGKCYNDVQKGEYEALALVTVIEDESLIIM